MSINRDFNILMILSLYQSYIEWTWEEKVDDVKSFLPPFCFEKFFTPHVGVKTFESLTILNDNVFIMMNDCMFHIMNESFLNLKIRTLRFRGIIDACIRGSYGVREIHRLFTLYSNFSSFFRSLVGNDIGSSSPITKIKFLG